MVEDGRSVPPSRARMAAAARAGVFPQSRLLVAGLVLASAGAVGLLLGDQIAGALGALVEEGLSNAVVQRRDPGASLCATLVRGLLVVLPLVLIPAASGILASLAMAIAARRGGGSTSVPVPPRPRRFSRGMLAGASLGVFGLFALAVLRAHGGALARSVEGLGAGTAWVGELVAQLVLAAGVTATVAGLADLALDRASLIGALALRPADALRDQRAASGDPELRARLRTEARRTGGPR